MPLSQFVCDLGNSPLSGSRWSRLVHAVLLGEPTAALASFSLPCILLERIVGALLLVRVRPFLAGAGVQRGPPPRSSKGTDKWSRFLVTVFTWSGLVADQGVFYSVVRLLKPAHTRALIESLLLPEVWDDYEPLEAPTQLDDGGALDGWLPTA